MAHTVAQVFVDDDGRHLDAEESKLWHLVESIVGCGERKIFCTGEFVDEGCNFGCIKVELKDVKRGGITCPSCLDKLKAFKAIKL